MRSEAVVIHDNKGAAGHYNRGGNAYEEPVLVSLVLSHSYLSSQGFQAEAIEKPSIGIAQHVACRFQGTGATPRQS